MRLVYSGSLICALLVVFLSTSSLAVPWKHLLVLGDSNVDNGNRDDFGLSVPPASIYYQERWSNGPVVSDYLPSRIRVDNAVNIAVGGATTGATTPTQGVWQHDLPNQVNYLFGEDNTVSTVSPNISSLPPAQRPNPSDTLVYIQIGGNDFGLKRIGINTRADDPNCLNQAFFPNGCWQTSSIPVYQEQVERLIRAGYRNFMLGSVVNFGVSLGYDWPSGKERSCGRIANPDDPNPAPAPITDECIIGLAVVSEIVNFAIVKMMRDILADPATPDDVQLIWEDSGQNFSAALAADPEAFGLRAVDMPYLEVLCGGTGRRTAPLEGANPDEYLYYDCVHYTTAVQRMRADYIASGLQAPAQLVILGELARAAGQTSTNLHMDRFFNGIESMSGAYALYDYQNISNDNDRAFSAFDAHLNSIVLGYDWLWAPFVVGASFDYVNGTTVGGVEMDFHATGGSVYLGVDLPLGFELFQGFQVFSTVFEDIERDVGFGGWVALGKTQGRNIHIYTDMSRRFAFAKTFALNLDFGFSYQKSDIDGYLESGANTLRREISSQEINHTALRVGGKVLHHSNWFGHQAIPYIQVEYRRLFSWDHRISLRQPASISQFAMDFVNAADVGEFYPSYGYDARPSGEDEGVVGLGVQMMFGSLVLDGGYKLSFDELALRHNLSVRLKINL